MTRLVIWGLSALSNPYLTVILSSILTSYKYSPRLSLPECETRDTKKRTKTATIELKLKM